MSDLMDNSAGDEGPRSKHGEARALADAALRAREAGETDRADMLLEQARRTDPDAVADLLQQSGSDPSTQGEPEEPSSDDVDEELALMSTQVQPHADAPSRSGITGSGSGADDMD